MIQRGISHLAGALLLALATFSAAFAQPPPRQPTPNDTLVSSEVHSDRRATFRIHAPKATDGALHQRRPHVDQLAALSAMTSRRGCSSQPASSWR